MQHADVRSIISFSARFPQTRGSPAPESRPGDLGDGGLFAARRRVLGGGADDRAQAVPAAGKVLHGGLRELADLTNGRAELPGASPAPGRLLDCPGGVLAEIFGPVLGDDELDL